MAIKNAGVTSVLAGQSDIVLFDAPTSGYTTSTTFENVTTNPVSLGQIVQDSTSWDGDEPSIDNILDEQGDIITAKVTAGTLAFSFEMADTSLDNIKKFLAPGATDITAPTTGGAWAASNGITAAAGFGQVLPVMTRPILVANDEANRALFFPKAKIVSNLSYADGLWRIRVSCTAETLDTKTLATGMLIEGVLQYDGGE